MRICGKRKAYDVCLLVFCATIKKFKWAQRQCLLAAYM